MSIVGLRFLVRSFASVLVAFTLMVYPVVSYGQMSLRAPLVNQLVADLVLDQYQAEYSKLSAFSDMKAWLMKHFPERDHAFLNQQLRGNRLLPKLERLNRGLALTFEGERYTIELVDAFSGRMKFNDRVMWTYNPQSPLSIQFEVFKRALELKHYSVIDLILPRAHAVWIWPVVAFVVGAGLAPVATDIATKLVYPWAKVHFCEGKDPSTSFQDAEYCDSYFKWKEVNRAKLPAAGTVPNGSKSVERVEMNNKCRSPGDPDIVTEVESPDKTFKTRRTIKFGPDNRPTLVIEELIRPPSPMKLIYTLNSKSGVETIESKCGDESCPGEKNMFLSRKKEHVDMMTPEKIKAIDKIEQGLKTIIPIIEQCDAKAKAAAVSADQPALLSSQVQKVEEEGARLREGVDRKGSVR